MTTEQTFDEPKKPEILITIDETGVQVYSNQADNLGQVLVWQNYSETPPPDTVEFEEVVPTQLNGSSESWFEELNVALEKEPAFNYKQFLCDFIERNI